jgi:acetate kinase
MNILVLNCGSSSVKFQIIATDLDAISNNADQRLARGNIERIGGEAILSLQAASGEKQLSTAPLRDTRAAVELILRWACSDQGPAQVQSVADIHAVGHRVVHGGEHFKHSVKIDDTVLRAIEDCIELAPLHNPTNIKGIQAGTRSLWERASSGCRLRHSVPPNITGARLSLRDPLPALSSISHPPLRLSWYVAPLRRLSLSDSYNSSLAKKRM